MTFLLQVLLALCLLTWFESSFLTCFHREISLERAERVYCKLFRFPSTILKNISLTKINAITKHWKNSVASLKHIMINLYENYVRLRSSIMAIRRIPKWSVWNTWNWNIYTTLGAFQRRFLTDLKKERYLILNDHMLVKRTWPWWWSRRGGWWRWQGWGYRAPRWHHPGFRMSQNA